jgi:hypothetical protein
MAKRAANHNNSQRWETIYCNSIGAECSPNTYIHIFAAIQYTIHNILQYIANILGRLCIFFARRYYQPCEEVVRQYHDQMMETVEDIMKLGRLHHPVSFLRGMKSFQCSQKLFAVHNHFNTHVRDVWDVVSTSNVSIHRNGLYSTLIGYFDASGNLQCDFEVYSYDHEGDAANLVMLKRNMTS